MLERGADVNATIERNGRTALALAAANGYRDVVELLIRYGADVNAKGDYNAIGAEDPDLAVCL